MNTKPHCPEFPYFGAGYPDATCIDGFLWDLDKCDENGQLYSEWDNPFCPFCNLAEHLDDNIDAENGITKDIILQHLKHVASRYGGKDFEDWFNTQII